jgi:hypothetical protein
MTSQRSSWAGPRTSNRWTGALYDEVAEHLRRLGHLGSDAEAALADWAGIVNLENRLVPGGIDARVLAELRRS